MKYLKIFENFDDSIRHFRYLDLEKLENGDLKIILNSEGKIEAEEYGISIDNFYDYFDDIRGNSDYEYFDDMDSVYLGMSNSPCITEGYFYDDNNSLVPEYENSIIFWYPEYVYKDFTEELYNEGYVIFKSDNPATQEEIDNFRLKKNINKYNL